MKIRTEKLDPIDLAIVKELKARNLRWLRKLSLYLSIILGVVLFIPAEILSLLKRRTRNRDISGQLFFELGPMNVVFFIIIPAIILLVLAYLYIFHIPKINKDLKSQEKEIGTVKVKEVTPLSDKDKKDLMGTADHIIKFEANPFKLSENYFLARTEPNWLNAKNFQVEVTKITKLELRRECLIE